MTGLLPVRSVRKRSLRKLWSPVMTIVLPSTSIADDWGTPGSPDVVCLPSQAL